MKSTWNTVTIVVALLTAVTTAGAGRFAYSLHDVLGRFVPAPDLSVVVVEIDGDPDGVEALVQAAGARSVQMALPAGHPLLGGVAPSPVSLDVGGDGRVRFSGGERLPLPEALGSLSHLHASQLQDLRGGTPLRDIDVVLIYEDPGLGMAALAPGVVQPVDRGVLAAVALDTVQRGGLSVVPQAVAALIAGLVTLGTSMISRSRPLGALWLQAVLSAALVVAVAVVGRSHGWDLPFGGLLLGVLLPVGARIGMAVADTLSLLDSLSLRIGGLYRWGDPAIGALGDMPEFLSLSFPGVEAAAWKGRSGLAPARVAASGELAESTSLAGIPAQAMGEGCEHVEPVYRNGRAVGALVLVSEGRIPEGALSLARQLARRHDWAYQVEENRVGDPFQKRLQVLRRGVVRTVQTASTWHALFTGGLTPMGVFDCCGDLVVGNRALRELIGERPGMPLLAALRGLVGEPDRLAEVLAMAQRARSTLQFELEERGGALLLTPLLVADERSGIMLQVIDQGLGGAMDIPSGPLRLDLRDARDTA